MDTTIADSDADTDNPESAADKLTDDMSAKLVPIQESSHSNTSRDIRLLEELDRKLENITEKEGIYISPAFDYFFFSILKF